MAGGLERDVRDHPKARDRVVAREREIRAGDPRASPGLPCEKPRPVQGPTRGPIDRQVVAPAPFGVARHGFDGFAEGIAIGEMTEIDAAGCGEPDVPVRAAIDLDDVELAGPFVDLEFRTEDSSVPEARE